MITEMQHRVEDNSSDGKISNQIFQPNLQDDTIIKVKLVEKLTHFFWFISKLHIRKFKAKYFKDLNDVLHISLTQILWNV